MMGSVGFGEILIIAIVAFFVFGPDRLPELAKRAGETIAKARKAVGEFTDSLDRESREGMAPLREIGSELKGVRDDLAKAAGSMFDLTGNDTDTSKTSSNPANDTSDTFGGNRSTDDASADSNTDSQVESGVSPDVTVDEGDDPVDAQKRGDPKERFQEGNQKRKQEDTQRQKQGQKNEQKGRDQASSLRDADPADGERGIERDADGESEPMSTKHPAETEGDSG